MQTLDLSPLLDNSPLRMFPASPPSKTVPNRRRLQAVLAKMIALKQESLLLYQPLPVAAAFHACRDKYVLAEGSNRSGKTNANCVELVRALLGCDPYDKYPKTNGVALIVGLKEDNIAMLWRKMAEPGAFKIIQDEETKLYRAVRPDPLDPLHIDPYDLAYREKWKDAPPILPPRFLPPHSIAWNDFGKGVPRTVRIPSTGWRLELRPSGSKPDQGDHYNVVCNDEEMERPDWYYEEVRGLVGLSEIAQHTPRLIWSATSQVANPEFAELRDKAMAGVPGFGRFVFLIKDNPYVPDAEKASFRASLPESEVATRYDGIPAIAQRYVYGTYEPMGRHGCEPFEIPANWTRYAIVDPGTAFCATLFCAVDPDEKHLWVTGGYVLRNATAAEWAYSLSEHMKGVPLEAIYMDERAGTQRNMNAADTTAQRFAGAVEQCGIRVMSYGPLNGFFPATNDIQTRTLAFRESLRERSYGPFVGLPLLQVMKGCCPTLDKQIKSALTDKKHPEKRAKVDGIECDLLDTVEYAAAADLRYHEPREIQEECMSPAVLDFRRWQKKHKNTVKQPCTMLG